MYVLIVKYSGIPLKGHKDTHKSILIGTSETVLIREVSLFQRLICTQKYAIGTSETVLIREVSLFQRLICT